MEARAVRGRQRVVEGKQRVRPPRPDNRLRRSCMLAVPRPSCRSGVASAEESVRSEQDWALARHHNCPSRRPAVRLMWADGRRCCPCLICAAPNPFVSSIVKWHRFCQWWPPSLLSSESLFSIIAVIPTTHYHHRYHHHHLHLQRRHCRYRQFPRIHHPLCRRMRRTRAIAHRSRNDSNLHRRRRCRCRRCCYGGGAGGDGVSGPR